jgi:hypothetical protein
MKFLCKKFDGCDNIIKSRIDSFSMNSKNVSWVSGSLFPLYYFGIFKNSCKFYCFFGKNCQASSMNGIKSESTTATIYL